MTLYRLWTAVAAVALTAMASTALAQTAPSPSSGGTIASGTTASASSAQQATADDTSYFARNRNVSVRERSRPGYEALGIPAGGFNIFPRVTADAAYDDNIYATQNSATSDTIFHIAPELLVRSNWNRHELDFYGRAMFNEYASHTNESTTDYGAGASGRLDLLRSSNLFAGGSFDRMTEPRTDPNSPAAAAKPIVYDLGQANVGGVWEFSRLRLSGRADYSDYNYFNTTTMGGAFLLQQDRSYHVWRETGRAEYAMSPELSLYATGTVNQIRYQLQPPAATFDRDSNGYDVAAGASFDVTRLIRGEAEIGYMNQNYRFTGFKGVSGLYYKLGVDWFPTQLTSVNLTGSRSIQEAVDISASGYIATTIAARIDHELLRNVILSAQGSYANDGYQQADRTDKIATAGVGATYLMNQHIGLRLAYDFRKLDSSGTQKIPSYDDNRLTASLTFQY
jgi:hypothetical protein